MKNLAFFILVVFSLVSCASEKKEEKAPNILFISIDDLRAELGVYGNPIIQTPNLDELAATGVAFSNHFVHVPTCGASRSSLLTGLRPCHLWPNLKMLFLKLN